MDGKAGNDAMRQKLDFHLDAIEKSDKTCKLVVHYKLGELIRATLEPLDLMVKMP